MRKSITFIVNLLQDVNVLRPLAYLAVRELGLPVSFLLSHKFLERDKAGLWQQELREIDAQLGAPLSVFHDELEAFQLLEGKRGLLIAGSESNLSAHDTVHNLFRAAPAGLVRVTLQHGFECVGFRQSRDQDIAHGRGVTFAADIVCGWFPAERMNAMAPSQRPKLVVTGPPMALQVARARAGTPRDQGGFVCENLHSPRFKAAGDFKGDFMDNFNAFCGQLKERGERVTLRPHPGGQYVVKNAVPLPENVTLETAPIYKVDLARYAYGISAPSSILIDMVLAGIPVAVWNDGGGVMDLRNYEGLTVIRSAQEWSRFKDDALEQRDRLLEKQDSFLRSQGMPYTKEDVQLRFLRLLRTHLGDGRAAGISVPLEAPASRTQAASPPRRVLFVANGLVPTLQLSFFKPLQPMVDQGQIAIDVCTEEQLTSQFGKDVQNSPEAARWLASRFDQFNPDLLVFCRYSGPQSELMLNWAREHGRPVIYHVDDDLLSIPPDIGQAKFRSHNQPSRIAAVRMLLARADLIYASNDRLKKRLQEIADCATMRSGKIYASGAVIQPAQRREVRTLGYMASVDHEHNSRMILPAIEKFLDRHPNMVFELFGSIRPPLELARFGSRIRTVPPVKSYETFLQEFSRQNWDIGICPLTPIPFNMVKADTKWVEYTSVGAAVVAGRNTVYDACCADGCGLLASTHDEWLESLEALCDESLRFETVKKAQAKLTNCYSTDSLRDQVLEMLSLAKQLTNPLQ